MRNQLHNIKLTMEGTGTRISFWTCADTFEEYRLIVNKVLGTAPGVYKFHINSLEFRDLVDGMYRTLVGQRMPPLNQIGPIMESITEEQYGI